MTLVRIKRSVSTIPKVVKTPVVRAKRVSKISLSEDVPVVKKRVVKVATKKAEPVAPPPIVEAPKKLEIEEAPIKLNGWAIQKTKCDRTTDSEYLVSCREYGIPFIISSNVNATNTGSTYVRIIETAFTPAVQQIVSIRSITGVTEAYAKAKLSEIAEASKEILAKRKVELEKVLNTPHVNIVDRRDYELSSKNYLQSNSNFVRLGMVRSKDGNISSGERFSMNPGAVCCALSKTNSDMVVNIPIPWMKYFGYNLNDLKAWISFLGQCDIGFTGYVSENIFTIADVFGKNVVGESIPRNPNGNYYMSPNMETYQVVLKANIQYRMYSYLYFIALRYMYNNQYWNIPFIAMQIKAGVGDDISFWDCLLLAHANERYYEYYSLVNNNHGAIAIPESRNSQANVLTSLRQDNSMNNSFRYSNVSFKTISDLIRGRDYKGLVAFVNKHKTK